MLKKKNIYNLNTLVNVFGVIVNDEKNNTLAFKASTMTNTEYITL
jgi:hypothetical protein